MIQSTLHHRPRRRAFTLLELLVVIMILGILASITTFALWDSLEEARAARTRAQIQKIHELLMLRWETYRTRPLPIRTSATAPETTAQLRLVALRELMRMEMPDRITDVNDTSVYLNARPALNLAYRRRIAGLTWSAENQQAECLYMILANIQDGTRNGLDFFRENEIGDIDADGMPEILDGWGRPIRFLRWAPGYNSPLQPSPPSALKPTRSAELAPDPFDPLRIDPRWKNNNTDDRHYPYSSAPSGVDVTFDDPFQLFPLVFSSGPDKLYHVIIDTYSGTPSEDDYVGGAFNGGTLLRYALTNTAAYATYNTVWTSPYPEEPWPTKLLPSGGRLWTSPPSNDPYVILPGCQLRIGATFSDGGFGDGAADNIDNHFLTVR